MQKKLICAWIAPLMSGYYVSLICHIATLKATLKIFPLPKYKFSLCPNSHCSYLDIYISQNIKLCKGDVLKLVMRIRTRSYTVSEKKPSTVFPNIVVAATILF